jgi:hypothetical protein
MEFPCYQSETGGPRHRNRGAGTAVIAASVKRELTNCHLSRTTARGQTRPQTAISATPRCLPVGMRATETEFTRLI